MSERLWIQCVLVLPKGPTVPFPSHPFIQRECYKARTVHPLTTHASKQRYQVFRSEKHKVTWNVMEKVVNPAQVGVRRKLGGYLVVCTDHSGKHFIDNMLSIK